MARDGARKAKESQCSEKAAPRSPAPRLFTSANILQALCAARSGDVNAGNARMASPEKPGNAGGGWRWKARKSPEMPGNAGVFCGTGVAVGVFRNGDVLRMCRNVPQMSRNAYK
jgi:hypothetical protein